jgi:two-component system chemotaxis response regulator CheY
MTTPQCIGDHWRAPVGEPVKKRVLIIDDANLVRIYYRDALERAGYDVDEALNGVEALEKLVAGSADLLILDVNMPEMDGLTFLKVLRQQRSPTSSVPALVTSSESRPHDIAAARAAGANFYLVKPLSQEVLTHYAAMLSGMTS